MNSQDFEYSIHQRLLRKDPIAPSELVENYIESLVLRLGRRFPNLDDPHFVHDAVEDALLNYAQHPKRFNPEKGKLNSYLFMSARGDLQNKLKSEGRRRQREVHVENVELHPDLRNISLEESQNIELPLGLSMVEIKSQIEQIITNQKDRKLLELILDGERKTKYYAEVLDITHLNLNEQRRQVKRAKDRLTKRLQRLGSKFHERK